MIDKNEIDFYLSKVGNPYDKDKKEDSEANNRIRTNLYSSMINASKKAAELLFGKENYDFIKHVNAFSPTSKDKIKFTDLLFTRISPKSKYSPIVQYWFRIDGKSGDVKIGIGLKDDRKTDALEKKSSKLIEQTNTKMMSTLKVTDSIDDEALADWIFDSIKSFEIDYEDFCRELQPDLDEALNKWIERQDKKTKKINQQNIWKMSHGKEKDISQANHEWLIENSFIAIGYDPKNSQRSKFSKMQDGDFFYLIRNSKVILLGQIDGKEIIDTPDHLNQTNWVMRKFKKIRMPITELNSTQVPGREGWKPQNASTVNVVSQSALVEFEKTILQPAFGLSLSDLLDNKKIKNPNEQNGNKEVISMLNRILYGPPGTGKTFNTINQALSIADPDFQKERKSRKEIKERFDQLIEEGQIVFTTFHQSMSYEDFIEGIKPVNTESDGSLTYEIQPGIFKALCDSAQTRNSHGFDTAYKKLQERLAQLNENEKLPLTTPTGKEFSISLNSKGNFYLYTGQDQNRQGVLTKDNLRKQINGEDIWYQGYNTGVLNLLEREYGYSPNQLETAKDYVLIIDEINRGNVSQIFGELITLIEDDKRLGKSEGISITLPYSKQKFGVPSNVYIIGTMNTADRSVEALDAALRRRFSFIEMPPKPALIKTEGKLKDKAGILDVGDLGSIDLANLLEVINKRIEKLLDSDHQIGHSFFLPVSSISSLKEVFQNKIIPLLKEYFYGDFGKLGLVLGKGFFEPTETSSTSIFADFGDFDSNDFSERVIYKLKNISSDELSGMNDDDFFEAISKLLNS